MNAVDIIFFSFVFVAMIVFMMIKHSPLSEEEAEEAKKVYQRQAVNRTIMTIIICLVIIVAGIYYMIASL